MKLSTGKVKFPIEFDNGEKTAIYFNPNDPMLAVRMKDFQAHIEARLGEIKDVDLDADGKPVEKDAIAEFQRVCNIMYEELDTAFGGDISSVVFKHCSPFAVVDGEYFVIQFIEAIKPEIEKQVKKTTDKMEKHIGKYAQ